MPLPLHQVVPVRLSDSRIPAAAENKLETVTNTTLCQVGDTALALSPEPASQSHASFEA